MEVLAKIAPYYGGLLIAVLITIIVFKVIQHKRDQKLKAEYEAKQQAVNGND